MLRKLPILLILVLFALPLFAQLNVVDASKKSPLTAPLTSFTLVGKVTLKQLGKLFGGQRVTPASNVKIKVVNFFDNSQKYTVTTDSNGMYGLDLPKGTYRISVEEKNIFYTPPLRVIKIGKNSDDAKNANFQGLKWPN